MLATCIYFLQDTILFIFYFPGILWAFAYMTTGPTSVEYKWIRKPNASSDAVCWEPDPYANKSMYSGSTVDIDVMVSTWGVTRHNVTSKLC